MQTAAHRPQSATGYADVGQVASPSIRGIATPGVMIGDDGNPAARQ